MMARGKKMIDKKMVEIARHCIENEDVEKVQSFFYKLTLFLEENGKPPNFGHIATFGHSNTIAGNYDILEQKTLLPAGATHATVDNGGE
jgi:hypothetical protein